MKITIIVIAFYFIMFIGALSNPDCFYEGIQTTYSQNKEFFLKTIPFSKNGCSPFGKTVIYSADSVKQYDIPRYLDIYSHNRKIFLSNDGKKVIYVADESYYWDSTIYKNIEIFHNGVLEKEYSLSDIIECNSDLEDCHLFYDDVFVDYVRENNLWKTKYIDNASDFEKKIHQNPFYFSSDTVTIFCKNSIVAQIDVKTNNLIKSKMSEFNENRIKELDTLRVTTAKFKRPQSYFMPNLSNGKGFDVALAEHLGYKLYPELSDTLGEFRPYFIRIECFVDKYGKASIYKIENYSEIKDDSIESFILNNSYLIDTLPDEIDKWLITANILIMNKDDEISRQERKNFNKKEEELFQKRIVADTIDGFYIPKNLEECFFELNKLLKTKEKNEIKNLPNRDKTIQYHLDLGMWLRNSWHLWGGSRLQQYFIAKGFKHPDDMTVLLLEFYYDWLNGKHDEWKAFEAK